MKRILSIGLAFLLVFFSVEALALDAATGSGEKTADAAVSATACMITSVHIMTDGTNNAKLILYDNASAASGTVIAEFTVNGTDHYGGKVWAIPRMCFSGIYGDVTGTGASYIVEYISIPR